MPTVLVVDDEDDIRYVVRRMIERMQGNIPEVHEASTGEDAIEAWRVHRHDVIILDQRMPGISGFETARRILAEEPSQPIILFTAFRDDGEDDGFVADAVAARVPKSQLHRLPAELDLLLAGRDGS